MMMAGVPDLQGQTTEEKVQTLTDYVIRLQKELDWLLQNLDSGNLSAAFAASIGSGSGGGDTGELAGQIAALQQLLSSDKVTLNGAGLAVHAGSLRAYDEEGQLALWFDGGLQLVPRQSYTGSFQCGNLLVRVQGGIVKGVEPNFELS